MRPKDKAVIIMLSYLLVIAIVVIVFQNWAIGRYLDLIQGCQEQITRLLGLI